MVVIYDATHNKGEEGIVDVCGENMRHGTIRISTGWSRPMGPYAQSDHAFGC
jgi:hypothetical protein